MLSEAKHLFYCKDRDFSTFSKSRAIRKDFTHTCKNDKGLDVSPTAQHDKGKA